MAEKIGSLEFDIIGVDNLSAIVDASKAKIQGLVDSTVKGGTSMDESFNKISREFEKAFGQVDTVIGANKEALKKLQTEYDVLAKKGAAAFNSGRDSEYNSIKQKLSVLDEEKAKRKGLLKEAYQAGEELSKLEDNVAAKIKLTTEAQVGHKNKIVETKKELETLGIQNLDIKLAGSGNITKEIDDAKLKIQALFSEFQKGSIKGEEASSKIKTEFEKAFGQIDTVIETNLAEIKKLEAEYAKLSSESGKAFQSGRDDDYRRIKARQDVLNSEIVTRKKLVSEASKSNTELASLEEKVAAKVKVTSDATGQYRTQIRAAKEELARMEAQGLRNTAAYQQLQEKTGKLTDQWKDATRQANIMANDQRGFQGIITGLGGISGAMSAAGGAYGLFAGENENLQKIMTKVQSLMAITIGLQQISQTLNKDSAFMLVTVNGLKKWWNEITGKSVVVETAEAVATKAATEAKKGQTGEIVKGTAATAGNTAATTTGTVATKGLAGGFKAVGLAIKSIPGMGWLLAGVAAVISILTLLNKKQKEAREEQRKFNKSIAEEAAKPVAKIYELSAAYEALGNDFKAKEKFLKDSKKDFAELGLAIDSVTEAENALIKNKEALIESQIAKSKGIVYAKMAEEKAKQLIEAQGELALAKKAYETAKRRHEAAPQDVSLMTRYSSAESNMKAWEEHVKRINDNITQLYINAQTANKNADVTLKNVGINTVEKYAKGSLKVLQEALSLKNEMFEKTGSDAERRKLKKEIDAIQKEIDKIDIRRKEKDDDPFLEQLQKQKAVYEQIEKDLKSTDAKVVQSAKDKYDNLKSQGETYLKYLVNEREKILSSNKTLNATQNKNIETLNKEISELTQSEAQKLIDEYGKVFDNRLELQEKYNKDVEILEAEKSNTSSEEELKILDLALKNRKAKHEADIDALYSSLEGKYKSYEQQRSDIHLQYLKERNLMEEKNAIDTSRGNEVTYSKQAFEDNKKAEAEAIKKIDDEETKSLLEKSELIKRIFSDFGKETKSNVKKTVADLKMLLAYMEGVSKTLPEGITKEQVEKIDDTEIAELYGILFELEDIGNQDFIFKGFIDGFNLMKKSAEAAAKSINATGKAKKELELEAERYKSKAFQGLLSGANDFSSLLGRAAGYMKNIAELTNDVQLEKSAEIMGGVVSVLEGVLGGAQSGNIWGAIAGGIVALVTTVIEGAYQRKAKDEQEYKDYKQWQIDSEQQINKLIIERIKLQTESDMAFLDEISKRIKGYQDAAAAAQQGLKNLYAQTEYEWEGNTYKGLEAIKGLKAYSLKTSGRDEAKNLASYDIWNKDKTAFDADKLEIFIAKLGQGDEELKAYLTGVLNLQKEYDNAIEQAAAVITSYFDSLGTSAIDAITNSIENGTDAWGEFKESAADALKSVVANMLYTIYMSDKMGKLKENLEKISKRKYSTEEERTNAMINTIGSWLNETESSFKAFGTALKGVYGKIDEMYGSTGGGNTSTLSGAIKGASQESIDLLAGQTNAVRLNQVESMNILRSQLFHLAAISSGIATSNMHLKNIDDKISSNSLPTDPLRAKGITVSAL